MTLPVQRETAVRWPAENLPFSERGGVLVDVAVIESTAPSAG